MNTGIGVYIKWESGKTVDTDDEWRLHAADVENCRYYVSTEGERYMTDDNANPPVCYNHGKCVPANSGNDDRPSTALTTTGTLTIDHIAGRRELGGRKVSLELSIGDIIRDAANKDGRVTSITDDNTAGFENSDTTSSAVTASVNVLKWRRDGLRDASRNHGYHRGERRRSRVPAAPAAHLLPDVVEKVLRNRSRCCGFRVSSVVDPEQYATITSPDHAAKFPHRCIPSTTTWTSTRKCTRPRVRRRRPRRTRPFGNPCRGPSTSTSPPWRARND